LILPSLQTGLAVLPHTAFQLVVLPETGLTVRDMGSGPARTLGYPGALGDMML
jgi:hypothetical protein